MRRFLRRILYGLAPTTLLALVLGIPTAAPDVSFQPVTVACSVDSRSRSPPTRTRSRNSRSRSQP